MQIGTFVKVAKTLQKRRYDIPGTTNHDVKWEDGHDIDRAIVLGDVRIYEGRVQESYYEDDAGSQRDFNISKVINAIAVQPIKGNRYLKPCYALAADLEAIT